MLVSFLGLIFQLPFKQTYVNLHKFNSSCFTESTTVALSTGVNSGERRPILYNFLPSFSILSDALASLSCFIPLYFQLFSQYI